MTDGQDNFPVRFSSAFAIHCTKQQYKLSPHKGVAGVFNGFVFRDRTNCQHVNRTSRRTSAGCCNDCPVLQVSLRTAPNAHRPDQPHYCHTATLVITRPWLVFLKGVRSTRTCCTFKHMGAVQKASVQLRTSGCRVGLRQIRASNALLASMLHNKGVWDMWTMAGDLTRAKPRLEPELNLFIHCLKPFQCPHV